MRESDLLLNRLVEGGEVSADEGLWLYLNVPLAELGAAADGLKRRLVADPHVVTWQIDRNVNTTNVCVSGCKFCNFHCRPSQRELAYVTSLEEYIAKIEGMLAAGGDQLLLQGGLNPDLGIGYYEDLFRELKRRYPQLKLNALGAPEVAFLARKEGIGHTEALIRLRDAGLDSLPGAGAEILDDGVRRRISPAKPSAGEWLGVMGAAHKLGIPTTATMMFGHVETPLQRVEHLLKIRALQARKPEESRGFTAFIPWTFSGAGTVLEQEGISGGVTSTEYLKTLAISRLILNNVVNIQVSWLTVGVPVAQVALHMGANDMGSIMIEENVLSSAGSQVTLDAAGMQAAIRQAGFLPRLRDQLYNYR